MNFLESILFRFWSVIYRAEQQYDLFFGFVPPSIENSLVVDLAVPEIGWMDHSLDAINPSESARANVIGPREVKKCNVIQLLSGISL